MYILLDANKFITTVSWGAALESGIEVKDFEFTEEICAYQYVDGEIVLNRERLAQRNHDQSSDEEVKDLTKFLKETDHIALQWLEEEVLNVDHHRSRADYELILQKRQTAREKIRIEKTGDTLC